MARSSVATLPEVMTMRGACTPLMVQNHRKSSGCPILIDAPDDQLFRDDGMVRQVALHRRDTLLRAEAQGHAGWLPGSRAADPVVSSPYVSVRPLPRSHRMPSSPPLAPALDQTLHFVLCDFGSRGAAYVEADPTAADELAITRNIVTGEYDRPLRVIACNPAEGWCRDVSAWIAKNIADVEDLPSGARAFVELYAQPDAMRSLDALNAVEAARKALEKTETQLARHRAKAPDIADLAGISLVPSLRMR